MPESPNIDNLNSPLNLENKFSQLDELSRYLSELESHLSIFWQLTPSLNIIFKDDIIYKVNPAWTTTLGFLTSNLVGSSVFSVIDPRDHSTLQNILLRLRVGEPIRKFYLRIIKPDGKTSVVRCSAKMDIQSKFVYAVGVDCTLDVEQKEKLEKSLLEAEYKTKALDSAPVGVIICGSTEGFPILYANPALTTITGFSEQEITDYPILEWLAEKLNVQESPVQLTNPQSFIEQESHIVPAVKKDGSTFYARIKIGRHNHLSGIHPNDQELIVVISDATQQVEQLNLLKEAMRESPHALFITDALGSCLFVNKKWMSYTGLTESEALGLGWLGGVCPASRLVLAKGWEDYIKEGVAAEKSYVQNVCYQNCLTGNVTRTKVMAYTYQKKYIIGHVVLEYPEISA